MPDYLRKLNDLFDKKERIHFFFIISVALLMALFQAVGIASVLPFINLVMDPGIIQQNHWLSFLYVFFNFKSANSFLIFSGFMVLGLLVIGNFISALSTWLNINFVWKKNHQLSGALLKKYLSMPYVYFLDQNTADLGKNVLAEVQQLTNKFLLPLMSIFTNSIIIIVILALLLYVNFLVTIGAAALLVFLYLSIYFYYSAKLREGGIRRIEKNKERYKSASEALSGIKDIKILGVEDFFLKRFVVSSYKFSYLQAWYQVVGQTPRYMMEVIAFGGIVGMLIYLVASNVPTDKIIPLISFFAFAGYRLMPSLQEVFNSLTVIRFNKAVLEKIHADMMKENPSGSLRDKARRDMLPLEFKKRVSLRKICFSYPGSEKNTLKNVDIEIEKGSFIALIGTTGSGKTTIADLLLGLLTPDSGSFTVDDVGITSENVKNWQANLGYVPQQIYLSDDTVARNIAFGLPDSEIDMERVKKAARMANIGEFVEKELPGAYGAMIGERGIRLSGGQRQRIGIARALYYDPEVLIFDEATSSLDNATEREVLKAIEEVSKTKTLVVIAHRLTTVQNCSKVYLIEKGKIAKVGSYGEIIDFGRLQEKTA